MVQPEMYVAVLGQGREDLQPRRGDPGGAEDGEPLGQRAELRVRSELATGVVEQLRRAGRAQVVAEGAPECRLPGEVFREWRAVTLLVPAVSPSLEHRRPGLPVRAERTGEPAGDRQPAPLVVVTLAKVLGQRPAPRLVPAGLGHLEQRPAQPRRRPPLHARGVLRRDSLGSVVEHPDRRRKQHVRAYPVASVRPEHMRQPLRNPSLHAFGRCGDNIGSEGVGLRAGEDLG